MSDTLNIRFIRQATKGLLNSDGWKLANNGHVRAGGDAVYQFVGSEFPLDGSFNPEEWCKLFFCAGQKRGTAYFGMVIEFIGGGDRRHLQRLLIGHDTVAWTSELLFGRNDLRLLRGWDGERGWDPYRTREADETPREGPVPHHEDPVAALRDSELPNLYLLRPLPRDEADLESKIRETLALLLPVWQSMVLHQLG